MARRVPARLTAAQRGRRFGLTVGTAFVVFGGIVWWREHEALATGFWVVGGVLILAALVIPALLLPVEAVWMKGAHVISKVTTPIVMGIVYYLVMLPIGLIMRMLGRNPMHRAERNGSFWVERSGEAAARGDMANQF